MKKIMFNDRYNQTNEVLDGSKTMLRTNYISGEESRYKVNDIVAIAQKYDDIYADIVYDLFCTKGWNDKRFVKSNLMINYIQITKVELQKLQDISPDDFSKEGIAKMAMPDDDHLEYGYFDTVKGYYITYPHAREAYKNLIDKLKGKGTWDKNPQVWVYTFKLVNGNMKYADFDKDIAEISQLEMLLENQQDRLHENINVFLKTKLSEGKNRIMFDNPIIMNYEELLKDYKAESILLDYNKFYISFRKPDNGVYETLLSNINNKDTLRILKIIYNENYKIL